MHVTVALKQQTRCDLLCLPFGGNYSPRIHWRFVCWNEEDTAFWWTLMITNETKEIGILLRYFFSVALGSDWRSRRRWEDNIRIDLMGNRVGRCGVDASGSG